MHSLPMILSHSFVEYCSYKGLTPIKTSVITHKLTFLVEYCSYKGLTLQSSVSL